jgi:sugar transferase (PEP-CTERM/EpsH1 system associated)
MRFYWSNRMAGQVAKLASAEPFDAAVAISVPMAPYVPPGMRFLLDMQDVDSEKWIQYAQTRHPAFLYAAEARRLRRMEVYWAHAAHLTLFTTRSEELLFQSFGDGAKTAFLENGVDLDYFDPERPAVSGELLDRRFALFLGTMDYHPNIEAAQWFAREALPEIRKRDAGFEFLIVGRSPKQSVLALARIPGVTVTGGVADTRPYLAAARAIVAPLRIARGIQNKVLEGLAMGKRVLVSPSVGKTFGDSLPVGVAVCRDAGDYSAALDAVTDSADPAIRIAAGSRFNWPRNLNVLAKALEALA